MTLNEQKIALVDTQHSVELKQSELRILVLALQATDENKAVLAKQKEIQDAQKVIMDLKKDIFG